MLCGYETNFRKNLYRHYINASTCRTPAVLNKKPTNKGSVKPISSKPTSKPVVSRGKVVVVKPVSSRPTVVLESAEPHSDQVEEIVETSVVSRESVVVRSAEPQSDQAKEIVETSLIEDDDAETNSILTFISHPPTKEKQVMKISYNPLNERYVKLLVFLCSGLLINEMSVYRITLL